MLIHIVKSPTEFTLELLARRGIRFDKNRPVKLDAVGLVQGKLAEMIVAADIATKSADVRVEEIKGVCPQHFMLIAIFGDTASVETALKNIRDRLSTDD